MTQSFESTHPPPAPLPAGSAEATTPPAQVTQAAAAAGGPGALLRSGCGPAELAELAAGINAELAALAQLQQRAAFRALRVGVMLLWAKERLLKHGQFEPWRDEAFPQSKPRLCVYQQLARKFVSGRKLTLERAREALSSFDAAFVAAVGAAPACLPALPAAPGDAPSAPPASPKEVKALASARQAVFDFLGEGSLNDALDRYGIKTRIPKPRGGDHGGGAARAELYADKAALRRSIARDLWPELIVKLRRFVFDDALHLYLDAEQVKHGAAALADILQALKQVNTGSKK